MSPEYAGCPGPNQRSTYFKYYVSIGKFSTKKLESEFDLYVWGEHLFVASQRIFWFNLNRIAFFSLNILEQDLADGWGLNILGTRGSWEIAGNIFSLILGASQGRLQHCTVHCRAESAGGRHCRGHEALLRLARQGRILWAHRELFPFDIRYLFLHHRWHVVRQRVTKNQRLLHQSSAPASSLAPQRPIVDRKGLQKCISSQSYKGSKFKVGRKRGKCLTYRY